MRLSKKHTEKMKKKLITRIKRGITMSNNEKDNVVYDESEKPSKSHPTPGNEEENTPGNPPVARTANDNPVWLNTSKDGDTTYLTVSRENQEDIPIFANNDVLKLALKWMKQVQRK